MYKTNGCLKKDSHFIIINQNQSSAQFQLPNSQFHPELAEDQSTNQLINQSTYLAAS